MFWTAQLAEHIDENAGKQNQVGCCEYMTLSIRVHSCQGGPPPSNLSSRPERSAVEGPAVPLSAEAKCVVGGSPSGSVFPSRQTAGPSTALRSGRDDKFKGGGPPWHDWSWMDRVGKKLIWTSLISQPSPSTSSHGTPGQAGQALRDWCRYTLIGDLFSARAVRGQGVDCASQHLNAGLEQEPRYSEAGQKRAISFAIA